MRAFQRIGYDETTLAIYDKALTGGDLLLPVPARPGERRGIASLLQRHHVHDAGYVGPGTLEQFSPSMPASPSRPGTDGRFGGRCTRTCAVPVSRVTPPRFTVIHDATRTAIDLYDHRYPPDLGA